MTKRYRLALIAHHAEKLVELVREQNDYGSSADVTIPIHHIEEVVRSINEHLNKEETKPRPLCERGATEDEVYDRKADWCSVCDLADCPLHGHDNLVICKHFHETKRRA